MSNKEDTKLENKAKNREFSFNETVVLVLATLAFILLFAVVLFTFLKVSMIEYDLKGANAGAVYHSTNESLLENGFYPARVSGDYSDIVFDFDAYLDNIGAKNVQKNIYQRGDGTVHELRFDLDDKNYCLETTVFKTDSYTFGLYTRFSIKVGEVEYALPTNNSGNFISDANSPMMFDYDIFDILHCVTDKDSTIRRDCQAGLEDNGCPFRGLGMAHYEQWSDGTVIWHDDAGNECNLHY